MADFVPHPLVVSVALQLAEKASGSTARVGDVTLDDAERKKVADDFAKQASSPGLSLFAGFLGGTVTREKTPWQLVYLDSRLDTWLLVLQTDIVVHQRLPDENAPSGLRDVLWVDATANVLRGSGPQTDDGRFLVGKLTQAGEFAASSPGGTFSAATGLLCEATTPGCCIRPRTR